MLNVLVCHNLCQILKSARARARATQALEHFTGLPLYLSGGNWQWKDLKQRKCETNNCHGGRKQCVTADRCRHQQLTGTVIVVGWKSQGGLSPVSEGRDGEIKEANRIYSLTLVRKLLGPFQHLFLFSNKQKLH